MCANVRTNMSLNTSPMCAKCTSDTTHMLPKRVCEMHCEVVNTSNNVVDVHCEVRLGSAL